jgi:phosphate transport system substrate-binding protein
VAMASRQSNEEEAAKLGALGLGDMRSPASEHVVALDGIAVVVHPNNKVVTLNTAMLSSIFAGETRDWSAVGGAPGPIYVYARDDASGTYDTFRHLILGKRTLPPDAKRFASSEELSDAVTRDRTGIGFVGLAYVRNAKALAVGEPGVTPLLPSPFTVTTEGYLHSRRLYLYTSEHPSDTALAFVAYALSSAGQHVVRAAGFIDLDVQLKDAERCDARCPPKYADLTKHARRLSLDFRFRSGTKELDTRAQRDLDRVVGFLRDQPSGRLMLLGFSDGVGSAADNVALSRERARTVAQQLEARGVHPAVVDGFGPEMPVSSNADETGRQRNRRVEVWLQD